MFDVITIGSATRDNYIKAKFPVHDWPDSPSKKAYVLPYGEKMGLDDAYFTIGGNAANASVTFARHGYKVACVAKIGSELPSKEFLLRLKKEGVKTKLIKQTSEKPTAYSVLLLSEEGERTILGYHGASDTFTMGDLNLNKMKSKWWYMSLAGESDKMYLPLLKFASENGVKVAFNPSGHHIKHKKEEILEGLKHLSFLVLNTGEAADLVGIPYDREQEVFKKLDELMPGVVAVTDGPKGVTVSDGKTLYKAGIYKEQKVVDRTGAGDSFGSGFVAVLAGAKDYKSPETIKEAIKFATANATAVVENVGATEGILTKAKFKTEERWKNFEIQTQTL